MLAYGIKPLFSQAKEDKFVIVTIERFNPKAMHKRTLDYWIVPYLEWEGKPNVTILPFFIKGFSLQDVNECCNEQELIVFNRGMNENFAFDASVQKDLQFLSEINTKNKTRTQKIKKMWTNGIKENINVYITPIAGVFCRCKVTKHGGNILNFTEAIIPIASFKHDDSFWKSPLSKQVMRYDFSNLPLIQLYNMD